MPKLDKERERCLRKARGEFQKLKDCTFEELRETSIKFFEEVFAFQFLILDCVAEGKTELQDFAADAVKQVRATNDKDFKIAEKNFKKMDKVISDCEKHNAIAEATSLISLMYVCAGLNAMGKRRLVTNTTLNEGLKLIPKRVKKHITDTLEMEPKRFDTLLEEALEATA